MIPKRFDSWTDFVKKADPELLSTELTFDSMTHGVMCYAGTYQGKEVICNVSEDCVGDYDYSAKEIIGFLCQAGSTFDLTIEGTLVTI